MVNEVQASPAIPTHNEPPRVEEVLGVFPNEAALEDAIARLTTAGFDRADLSLPLVDAPAAEKTPEQGAAAPMTEDDRQQARTLHISGFGSAAALAAAGVTVATGGAAAVAAAAALAAGAAAGGVAAAITRGGDMTQHEDRAAAAAAGRLMLSARVTGEARKAVAAEAAMRAAGAAQVTQIARDRAT
jgi:hypothetical protein